MVKEKRMNSNKNFLLGAVFIFSIILLAGSASAGFSDWWSKVTGKATSGTTAPNITVINSAPTIINTSIAEVESGGITLTEGLGKNVSFNFTVHDDNGIGSLDNLTAVLIVNKTGETDRGNNPNFGYANNSCINVNIDYGSTNATYQCNFTLYYWDGAGTWNVNVSIRDSSGALAANLTPFTVNTLTAMKINPPTLNWSSVSLSSIDQESTNDPLVINNTGNDINLSIMITAYSLQGEITTTENIPAANFSAVGGAGFGAGCSGGTAMVNTTSTNTTTAHLNKGNNTIQAGDVTSGQEQVYFCLQGLPQDISAQAYSTKGTVAAWSVLAQT